MKKPKIAVSACLLGKKVRYNGEDTKDLFVSDILPKYFKIVPFCPELEMGLGVPREPVNLILIKGKIKMIGIQTGKDYTIQAKKIGKIIAESLSDVDGIIFQKKSPSCGSEKVKIYVNSIPKRTGVGIFAEIFLKMYPEVPYLDSLNLNKGERFMEQVFSRSRNA